VILSPAGVLLFNQIVQMLGAVAPYAWPIVVLGLGLTVIIMFRRSIAAFLERVEKVSAAGVIATLGPGKRQEPPPAASISVALLDSFNSAMQLEMEERIQSDDNFKKLSPDDKIKTLVRFQAAALITVEFERVYRVIFGSQQRALKYVNERPGVGVEAIQPFYETAKQMYPVAYERRTFEDWLGFLMHVTLIRDQTQPDGRRVLYPTVRGQELLKYVIQMHYPENFG
jgi:hypothetical protein